MATVSVPGALPAALLLRRRGVLDEPRARFGGAQVAAGLLDDLNLHECSPFVQSVIVARGCRACLSQRVDDDVDEPGAEGSLLCFLVVRHDGLLCVWR